MHKTKLLVSVGIISLLTACASSPKNGTFAERLMDRGDQAKSIAKKWDDGNSMVTKGEKMKTKGQKMIEDGKNQITKGERLIQDGDSLIENGKKMYTELSDETATFFNFMLDNELMDLVAKKGKAGGGYCTYISGFKSPFIFSNFNGTSADIDVLTHEVGHAFQVYMSRGFETAEYYWPTSDGAEIHSMSMEYFAYPWMDNFFNGEADKYRYSHLVDSLLFLPYGVAVDEFQHGIYAHPEWTPIERKNFWSDLEKKYQPYKDYDGNKFLMEGGFWQTQAHIYQSPFYYIDYTLAQICAFQFWLKARQDNKSAFKDYVKLCKAGGSKSFLELVDYAGLRSPFQRETVSEIVDEINQYLSEVDDSRLN